MAADRPLASQTTWREAVHRQAMVAGVDLPDSTVDEISAHVEDVYLAAREDGVEDEAARVAAAAVLESAALEALRHHAAGAQRRLQSRQARDAAPSAGGRSFNVTSALRMAVRQLWQHPGFAAITVLVLGLGTGAATAVFTVVDSVILRPLPFERPDRLVTIWDTNAAEGLVKDPISPVNFMDQRTLPVFADAAAWWRPGINLADPGLDPVRVKTIEVSGNIFDVLGVSPQIGAGFPQRGPIFVSNELIAVISDRLWRTRYSADPAIVGRPLTLNGTPYIVVGVMPPKFHYPDDVDVWQRLRWDLTRHSRQAHFMEAVARLKDDATIEQAQSAVDSLWTHIEVEYANTRNSAGRGWGSRLVPLLDQQLGYYRPALLVLFGAVGLLLLIGVLNVASLLLTRALSREREIAVRVAMGASPRQLVMQLMSESLVLSAAGAGVGIAAAAVAIPAIVALTPVTVPRLDEAGVDLRALGLGLAIVGVTTVFFGLVPALLMLRGRLTTDLKSGERGSSRSTRRIYSLLVTAEVALACVLLVSSALLVSTVRRMTNTPLGVRADDVLTTTVQLTVPLTRSGPLRTQAWQAAADTHARILEQVRAQPGVESAGGSNFLPLDTGWRNPFAVDGQPIPPRLEDLPQAQMHSVSEGYLEAMGAELIAGRSFTAFDGSASTGVMVVNESFARRHLPGSTAVGRSVRIWSTAVGPLGFNLLAPDTPPRDGMPFDVVGVIKDVRNVPLGQTVEPAMFLSTRQFPFSDMFVAVKASSPGVALAAVRTALTSAAPEVPMGPAQTWGDRFSTRSAEPRVLMTVLLFFGALAALLAALGVYGLFSWAVAMRQRELAIRLTLGAKPLEVGGLVVRQSILLVVAGLGVGLALIRTAEGVLARVLYEVQPGDLGSTIAAAGLLLAAALVASVPPTLKAMRVDPVEGLRAE